MMMKIESLPAAEQRARAQGFVSFVVTACSSRNNPLGAGALYLGIQSTALMGPISHRRSVHLFPTPVRAMPPGSLSIQLTPPQSHPRAMAVESAKCLSVLLPPVALMVKQLVNRKNSGM
jgi:hypothetical protein